MTGTNTTTSDNPYVTIMIHDDTIDGYVYFTGRNSISISASKTWDSANMLVAGATLFSGRSYTVRLINAIGKSTDAVYNSRLTIYAL